MRISLCSVVVFSLTLAAAAQQQPPYSATLPPRLKALGDQLLDRTRPEASRVDTALELAEDTSPATLAFLAATLPGEPSSAVRRAIIGALAQSTVPEATAILRSVAATERARDTGQFFDQQLQGREDEASTDFFRSAPTPPVETITIQGDVTRVLVIGDFGTSETGSNDLQEQVATALKAFHKASAPNAAQFGLTVGDNFYPMGVTGAEDPRWKTDFEGLYGAMGLRFYGALGNHDHYGGSASTKGQIQRKSDSWKMPAQYYSVVAGGAHFFVIDTQKILNQQAQLEWLDRALGESKATWKIVVGHHPVASGGKHGINGELQEYREKLLPVLRKHNVSLYLTGHDHDMQMLRVEGQYEAIVGGSGQETRQVVALDESMFCSMSNGFGFLEAAKDSLRVRFLRAPDGQALYDCTVKLDPQTQKLSDQCAIKC